MLIQNSAIAGLSVVLSSGVYQLAVFLVQILGYGIVFYDDPPEFDDSALETEVKWLFHILLAWHLLLGILMNRSFFLRRVRKRIVPVPFMTYLVLIQLVMTAYLLETWLIDPP